MSVSTLIAFSFLAGVVFHLGYFIRGQHDLATMRYVGILALHLVAAPWLLSIFTNLSLGVAFIKNSIVLVSFYSGLFASILIYRLYFHRLRAFPGPKSWAISKLFQFHANINWRAYANFHNLHENYGLFVRVGPTELSVIHPSAPQVILGPSTKCTKGVWYDMAQPLRTMHQTGDIGFHDFRRRSWDRAFSQKALQVYELIISEYADMFIEKARQQDSKPINLTKWSYWYAWDIVGNVGFGKRFGALESLTPHFAIANLFEYIRPMGIFIPIPWLFQIFKTIRSTASHNHPFIDWCNEQLDSRIKEKTERQDAFHHLLKAPLMTNNDYVNRNWLEGDARLLIVAGSDTVAAVLASSCYELIRKPEYIKTLRKELESISKEDGINTASLAKAPLLNAIVNEALRLHHPVPSGLVRQTPPEGIMLGETFIPGNITVTVPFHALQRSPASFAEPNDFIPERWTTRPELVLHPEAFAPFSLGRYNCVGKRLAQTEIWLMLAKIVMNFDMGFAPGEDGSNLDEHLEDHFITSPGDLWVVFRSRD
ncbi:cytochrome P450 [Pyrenochaeta sp. MPI-SDFR-AT-0127]|nr:cytochrome P450 [Pyrenochaeta sp. MPI-SDFR-AT-0127]